MNTRTQAINLSLSALALGACVTARAAAPVIADIAMVPRLAIESDIGSTNQIQYSTDLKQPSWTVLTNVVVTNSPFWFVDVDAPPAPERFYRVVALNPMTNAAPANMVLISAGWFTMGDGLDGDSDARPVHGVYVSGFYMDKYEVTKALWDDVFYWATANGYSFDDSGQGKAPNHPVHSISWYDCVKWCNARSEKEGRTPAYYTEAAQTTVYRSGKVDVKIGWVKWNAGYRLPTEAEWEKAARGGANGHRFPWSNVDTITHSQANYWSEANNPYTPFDLSPTRGFHPDFSDGGYPYTSPVGHFAPNGYGLYDMAGNVAERCWDWYGSYDSAAQTDPRGLASGSYRVIRGGAWGNYWARHCRSADRSNYGYLMYPNHEIGLRVVLSPGP